MYTFLISVFMNNNLQIFDFEFFIFLFSNIAILAYFDANLPFLSLKFPTEIHLHAKYWMK